VTPRPVLLGGGLAALALAFPGPTPGGVALTVLGLAALWPAVARPGSQAPALLLGVVLVRWLTAGAGAGALRLVGLVVAVAVVHFAAALGQPAADPRTPPGAAARRRPLRRRGRRRPGRRGRDRAAAPLTGADVDDGGRDPGDHGRRAGRRGPRYPDEPA
jgi:hypothetical protein